MLPPLFGKQEVGIQRVKKRFPRYGVPIWSLWPNIRFLPSMVAEKNVHICSMCIKTNQVGKQEVGIWRVKKRFPWYGAPIWSLWPNNRSAINSCGEKCACIFNVYKKQPSQQTGSRNTTGPKTLPTIWHTYMKLVTKYQIPVINSCLEKCNKISKQEVGSDGSKKCFPRYGVPIWRLLTKYQISAIKLPRNMSIYAKCA
jgi:hypothetical protein